MHRVSDCEWCTVSYGDEMSRPLPPTTMIDTLLPNLPPFLGVGAVILFVTSILGLAKRSGIQKMAPALLNPFTCSSSR